MPTSHYANEATRLATKSGDDKTQAIVHAILAVAYELETMRSTVKDMNESVMGVRAAVTGVIDALPKERR